VNTVCLGASFMYKVNRLGDKTEHCGTLACISLGLDISPSIKTLNLRCERKDRIGLVKLFENANFDNLYSNPECHAISRSFSMCKNTASVDILWLKLRVT
jgi:hypothetical protein